jgi:hypothetical protein
MTGFPTIGAKREEEQRQKQTRALTKDGLQFKIGGFAELDSIHDNPRIFPEIIGNRPVLCRNRLT